jgi:SAM-dependent methyltransferase
VNYAESVAWRPEIEGYSEDILPFYSFIQERIPRDGRFIEVGVYKGRSFRFMRELRPDLHMVAIDPMTDESCAPSHATGLEVRTAFYATMRDALGWTMWSPMTEIANTYPFDVVAADFIFLDGDHNYPGVCADITAARKILRPGGILAGHDFAGDNGVVRAVKELAPGYQLAPWDGPELCGNVPGHSRCWWVQL